MVRLAGKAQIALALLGATHCRAGVGNDGNAQGVVIIETLEDLAHDAGCDQARPRVSPAAIDPQDRGLLR